MTQQTFSLHRILQLTIYACIVLGVIKCIILLVGNAIGILKVIDLLTIILFGGFIIGVFFLFMIIHRRLQHDALSSGHRMIVHTVTVVCLIGLLLFYLFLIPFPFF